MWRPLIASGRPDLIPDMTMVDVGALYRGARRHRVLPVAGPWHSLHLVSRLGLELRGVAEQRRRDDDGGFRRCRLAGAYE